jgi:tetraacyldisaccharide 4'-kinase
MLAALGQPSAFERTLEALGATVIARRTFRDHHRYRARDLRDLERDAALWVTSEKDAVKILPAWARRIDLRVLTIELDVEQGEAFVDWVEQQLC